MLPVTILNSLHLSSLVKEEMVICFQAVISVFLVFKKFSCRRNVGIVENSLLQNYCINCGKMHGKAAHVAKRIPTDLPCSLQRFVYSFY